MLVLLNWLKRKARKFINNKLKEPKNNNQKLLLAADAVINLILGALLLFFPVGILELFGLPPTDTYFYSSILGGVIIGIGVALYLEWRGGENGSSNRTRRN